MNIDFWDGFGILLDGSRVKWFWKVSPFIQQKFMTDLDMWGYSREKETLFFSQINLVIL